MNKDVLNHLPQNLFAYTDDFSASLEIDFFENRIVIYFKDEKKTLALSVFLSVIYKKELPSPEWIQECYPLYNREFAEAICPKMGYASSANELVEGVRSLYLGFCTLGLGKSIADHGFEHVRHQRELLRISNIMKGIEPFIYAAPIR